MTEGCGQGSMQFRAQERTAGQATHELAPAVEKYFPPGQEVQAEFPVPLLKRPLAQLVQLDAPAAE